MGVNSFGNRFVITTFGESHGVALGVIVDGCPSGINFDHDLLLRELQRRRPGHRLETSSRNEEDHPEILSGLFEGVTLGTPIALLVRNKDARSADYHSIAKNPRKGHADDLWRLKFGHSDIRGGGRASGRETVARVMGGAVAQMLVRKISPSTQIQSYVSQCGDLTFSSLEDWTQRASELSQILTHAKAQGESWGGSATVIIHNPMPGLGEPVFCKLKSDLAMAMMSVGGVVAFELGAGIHAASQSGSSFHKPQGPTQPPYGGIRGGISTGENILCKVTFKPPASLGTFAKEGRHDPFIVLRALPVLEAMAWLVLADHHLHRLSNQI